VAVKRHPRTAKDAMVSVSDCFMPKQSQYAGQKREEEGRRTTNPKSFVYLLLVLRYLARDGHRYSGSRVEGWVARVQRRRLLQHAFERGEVDVGDGDEGLRESYLVQQKEGAEGITYDDEKNSCNRVEYEGRSEENDDLTDVCFQLVEQRKSRCEGEDAESVPLTPRAPRRLEHSPDLGEAVRRIGVVVPANDGDGDQDGEIDDGSDDAVDVADEGIGRRRKVRSGRLEVEEERSEECPARNMRAEPGGTPVHRNDFISHYTRKRPLQRVVLLREARF
jgi:hypothetical protein